jgi:AAA family ATP:ADP antiporter
MNGAEDRNATTPARSLERALRVFADVRDGEGPTALLLTLGLFLLLMAYYVIKPIRDSLITGVPGGPEIKSYMGAAIAVALLFAVPAYARFASRVPRNRLLLGVSAFFVSNLLLFYATGLTPWANSGSGQLGFALGFYLWVGVFNMMIVAQYWAFANDIYSDEQGKRIFPLIGIGASVGAAVGSMVLDRLVRKVGTTSVLPVAGLILAASGAITLVVHARESRRAPARPAGAAPPPAEDRRGAFTLVLSNRYLLLVALFTLLFTFVNTNGEYVKDRLIKETATMLGAQQGLDKAGLADLRTELFNQFYFFVNLGGVVLQSFVVSRIVRLLGLRRGFFIMPAVAFVDATVMALVPVWNAVRFGKIAENATDYSLNNTLRNVLWLPTTRLQKYVGKQAVDAFFVRSGDVASAVCVYLMADRLGLGVRAFAIVSLVCVAVWFFLARAIVVENARLTSTADGTG